MSRWSDVAATGRPALPAEGVGWRTQTSEWRSTAESARWRQTTEWRSSTGSHGWRTTTEAWQSGDSDAAPPRTELPTRLPAISGTAWPTPTDDQPGDTPSWQQPVDPTPSWQQPGEARLSQPSAIPPWEQARANEDRPAWQQFTEPPAAGTPSWQPADAPPPRRRAPEGRPTWETRPSWQQFTETSAPAEGSWRDSDEGRRTPSAPTSYSGNWSAPIDDGRHLVREDDRAAWRESAAGQARPADAPPAGRRRAPDVGSRTSGGTGWTVRSDADNWAGHTDTGSIPAFPDPAAADVPSWRRGSTEPPAADGWRTSTTTSSWQSPPATDAWRSGDQARTDSSRTDSWRTPPAAESWRSGDESRAGEPRPDSWRDTGSWRRDPEPGPPVDPWAQSATETGVIPLPLQPRDTGSWPGRTDPGSGQRDGESTGRRSRSDTGSWQSESPSGSWTREPEAGGRQGRIEPSSWHRDPENGRPDTGSWQRGIESGRPDIGSWQREADNGRTDTGSWRRDGETDTGSRRRDGETDTGSWRRGMETGRPDPGAPQHGDDGRTDTGSWRRGMETGRPDPGAPQHGDDGRADTGSRRRGGDNGARSDSGSWQRGLESDGRTDTGSWRREADSPRPNGREVDSWPREPDTGRSDTGSWRREPDTGRSDTGSWRRDQEPPAPSRGEIERWPGSPPAEPRRDPESFRAPSGEPPRDFEPPSRDTEPRRARRADSPREPEPRRGVDGQRSGGMPREQDGRGPDGPRGFERPRDLERPRGPRRPELDRGPEAPRDYADRSRRRERDTSWQRELESGAWHRDPESDVWLRDSDTGQWHRQELEDEDDEDEDRGPRRGPRDDDRGSNGGGRRALESREAVARRGDEAAQWRTEQPADPDGGGRRRAPETRSSRLQLTAAPEAPLDPEAWRRDSEATTRPITRPSARRADVDMPVSAQPAVWQRGDETPDGTDPDQRRRNTPYEAQPDGFSADYPASAPPSDRRPATDRPVSAQPGDWRREADRPVSAQPSAPRSAPPDQRTRGSASVPGPDSWQRDAGAAGSATPVSSQPGGWRAEAQAAARTDAWRNQLRAEQGEPPIRGDAATEIRPRAEPAAWQQAAPEDEARGSATYREAGTGDWRRELNGGSDLADGESRRISTSDFVPFRPPSKNGAAASVKVPAANSASEGATEVFQRTGARWQDPPDTQWPPRGAVASAGGTYERRPVSTLPSPSARQNDLLEPDEELEEDTGGPLAAVGYTVVWYGVPVVLLVLYMLVLNGTQQARALDTLAGAAPQFGLSLVLSMLVAVGLRWASGSWKAASVGLAAAVMGGGLATVLTSAITGQSLS